MPNFAPAMKRLPASKLLPLAFALMVTGCFTNSTKSFEILSENSSAVGKVQSVVAELGGREGIYPGIDVSGFIGEVDSSKGPYWVRISVTDAGGKVLSHDFGPQPAGIDSALLDEVTRSSQAFDDTTSGVSLLDGPYVAKRPLVWEQFLGHKPGGFHALIPYPVLPSAKPGAWQETHILIEGFFGTHADHSPLAGDLAKPASATDKPDIVTKAVIRYTQPNLRKATITVAKVEVNPNGETDSHDWDFGLFSGRDNRGYPDLMWQLEVDDKYAWESPIKIHNSLTGNLSTYPCEVWIATLEKTPKLTICFLDWDNENLFNNRHDEIGCWEGELNQLSSNSRNPTVLKCGDVSWGEVSVK
jgi:hypothetical protein